MKIFVARMSYWKHPLTGELGHLEVGTLSDPLVAADTFDLMVEVLRERVHPDWCESLERALQHKLEHESTPTLWQYRDERQFPGEDSLSFCLYLNVYTVDYFSARALTDGVFTGVGQ